LSKKTDFIFPLFCGLLAYIVYELTNAQGLFWGDDGEFIAASSTLGIGHAYGHPLFWLVGRISIMLNPSNPAAAMNHLVALFSAGSCFVIALLAQNWVNDKFSKIQKMIAIFTAVGIYAVAPTVWSQASYVEVYNFQAFFLALAVYFLDRYFFRKGNNLNLFASAYFFGIAVTLGLYALLLAILPLSMWLVTKRKFNLKIFLLSAIFFIVGLSLWLYLPIRSAIKPIYYHWEKINSLTALLKYLSRKSYSNEVHVGFIGIPFTFTKTLKLLFANIGMWGIVLLIFSGWSIISDKKERIAAPYFFSALFLTLAFILTIPFNLTLIQMTEIGVYFIPVFLLCIPLFIIGINKLLTNLKSQFQFLLILPILIYLLHNWNSINISKDHSAEKFMDYLTSTIPTASKILPASDTVFHPLYYYIFGLGNPNHYTLLRNEISDSSYTAIVRSSKLKDIYIEIDNYFLRKVDSIDHFRIAGPFAAFLKNSSTARKLESNFVHNFSFDNINLDKLNRETRRSFSILWMNRGAYWFNLWKRNIGRNPAAQEYRRKSLLAYYKAFSLNNFDYVGSFCAAHLSIMLIQSGQFKDAERFAHQALKIHPFAVEAYRTLYGIAVRGKEFKRAFKYLRKLSRLEPKDGEIHLDMAALYHFLNQPEKAKKEYSKGIKLGAKPRKKLEDLLFPR